MPIDFDLQKIQDILEANKHLNFVQRIQNPGNFPSLDLGNGQFASHKMSWSTIGDKGQPQQHIVYPNVIRPGQGKPLVELHPDKAFEHAMKNKQFIPFDNPKDADWFSQSYKSVWDQNRVRDKQLSDTLGGLQ